VKLGRRILLSYFLIVGLAAWFLLYEFVEQVRPGVRMTLEDTLADTANLLAVLVADDIQRGKLEQSALLERIKSAAQRSVGASGSGATRPLGYRVYITDARGTVVFDSEGRDTGKDYSQWNDVYLTLRGQYGARSTRGRTEDPGSTVMHVAAPIKDRERIIGVLTVAKPISTVQPFVERSQRKIVRRGSILLVLSLLIGVGFAMWLTLTVRKLMHYIADVEAGKKATLPALGNNEFGRLGRALESMRHQLEGKEYVEEVMHTLAHELKSPIAAIQGTAELLREDMPEQERAHFLNTILQQNLRQKQLIDKLLALVRVEKQQDLAAPAAMDAHALLEQVWRDCAARLAPASLQLSVQAEDLTLHGDPLLLRQAIGNLVDNAIDFAPRGSTIELTLRREQGRAVITVRDRGPGIPEFALARVFERFYSLPRADGARSTGLGLPFVREVMTLHKGVAQVENASDGGAVATLRLPLA
jgi:two-component system sensor histidine kinase CreC